MPSATHKSLNRQTFDNAVDTLCANDEQLCRIVELFGAPAYRKGRPGFKTLVRIVLEQQISVSSGLAAYGRLEAACERVTPERLLELGPKRIAATGQTRQKTGYLVGLSETVAANELNMAALSRIHPDKARAELVAIKGIGNWTADCYLLALNKPDIWPVGDLALANAVHKALNLRKKPSHDRMTAIGKRWQPHRSVAARMLWHYYRHGAPKLK